MAVKAPFKLGQFLLSLSGRVSRRAFILFEIPIAACLLIGPAAARHLVRAAQTAGVSTMPHISTVMDAIGFIAFILLWPRFAVVVKRLHDIGLPWFSGLLLFLPVLASQFDTHVLQADIRTSETSGFMVNFDWVMLTLNGLAYLLILGLCFVPARAAGDRYAPRPHRAGTAPDIF